MAQDSTNMPGNKQWSSLDHTTVGVDHSDGRLHGDDLNVVAGDVFSMWHFDPKAQP